MLEQYHLFRRLVHNVSATDIVIAIDDDHNSRINMKNDDLIPYYYGC